MVLRYLSRRLESFDEALKQAELLERERPEIAPLLKLSVTTRVLMVPGRIDREIAILRLVESLRIYGAKHNAHLPQSLADVVEIPVPPDPVTGKPFEYRLEGETAILSIPPLPGRPTQYEIKMAKP